MHQLQPRCDAVTTDARKARWWSMRPDGRIECELCPRRCKLRDGQHGFCVVRQRRGTQLELIVYGRHSGLSVDPIEKKPLHHFLPGTNALSFGTTGCNLGCTFCQNWRLSRARAFPPVSAEAAPSHIVAAAQRMGCRSVAFTYNDPVVFAEYAIDTARACRAEGIGTLAVTAGYICASARAEFFGGMDAANVDLKAFSDDFYRRRCRGRLQPVLDTLMYLHRETPVWLEVTTLLIPGVNDSDEELDRATDWFAAQLGPDVPWHFSAFHPAYEMTETPCTPASTLFRARSMAIGKGIRFVYTGNIGDRTGSSTQCPDCGATLIDRVGYSVAIANLAQGKCVRCGTTIPGRFALQPPRG